jgi:hypothetical protein
MSPLILREQMQMGADLQLSLIDPHDTTGIQKIFPSAYQLFFNFLFIKKLIYTQCLIKGRETLDVLVTIKIVER